MGGGGRTGRHSGWVGVAVVRGGVCGGAERMGERGGEGVGH